MSGAPFHYDPAIKRYFFKKVPDSEVEKTLIARAQDVRAFVCPELRIEPPKIVWLRPAPPNAKREPLKFNYQEELDAIVRVPIDVQNGTGVTPQNLDEIWIPSDLTAHPNLEYVVAHELRHVAQKKHCPDVFADRCRAEGDAYPYGYEVLKQYFAAAGRLTDELRQELDRQETETQKWFPTSYPHGEYKTVQCLPPGQSL